MLFKVWVCSKLQDIIHHGSEEPTGLSEALDLECVKLFITDTIVHAVEEDLVFLAPYALGPKVFSAEKWQNI